MEIFVVNCLSNTIDNVHRILGKREIFITVYCKNEKIPQIWLTFKLGISRDSWGMEGGGG